MESYKDKQHMYDILSDVWNHALNETELGDKLSEYEVTYKFDIKDPDGYLYISPEGVITGNDANKDAVITMELSAETVHQFWLNKINLPVALATRKIKSKGPIPKVLKMLPYLKSVYEIYPEFCKKHGLAVD